jgi:hypothetical protein
MRTSCSCWINCSARRSVTPSAAAKNVAVTTGILAHDINGLVQGPIGAYPHYRGPPLTVQSCCGAGESLRSRRRLDVGQEAINVIIRVRLPQRHGPSKAAGITTIPSRRRYA